MSKFRLSFEEYEIAQEDGNGFCIACGYEQGGVEPDAVRYECEDCGKAQVFGAEELLLMGYVT